MSAAHPETEVSTGVRLHRLNRAGDVSPTPNYYQVKMSSNVPIIFTFVSRSAGVKSEAMFPAGSAPDSQSLRACVPCINVSLAASRAEENAPPSRKEETIRGDNVSELSRQQRLHRITGPLVTSLSTCFFLDASPSLASLPPTMLSVAVIAAHLLGSPSAALSASLLQD